MSRSFNNRVLTDYYDVYRTRGQAAADALFDVYENTGFYADDGLKGLNVLDRANDIKNSKAAKKALGYVDELANPIQRGIQNLADKIPLGKGGATLSRMAGSGLIKNIARAIPVLGAVQSVADVGDIVFGDESLGNKVMDGTAMAIGGTIGATLGLGNPILAAAGASTGKFVSDGLQYLFGDKKTPEQRKMEEALAMLKGGYV